MLLKKIISLDKESQKRGQEMKKQVTPNKKFIGVTKKNEIIKAENGKKGIGLESIQKSC